MKLSTQITAPIVSLALSVLPALKAEEQASPKLPTELQQQDMTKKSEQGLKILNEFATINADRQFQILKASEDPATQKLLQERDAYLISTLKKLSAVFGTPLPELNPPLTPEVFEKSTKPLVDAFFKADQTILFPRSLNIENIPGLYIYSLPAASKGPLQVLIPPHLVNISGVVNLTRPIDVHLYRQAAPFFELIEINPNKNLISLDSTLDFVITNKTGIAIFKDRIEKKHPQAATWLPIPYEILEKGIAVKLATFVGVQHNKNIPDKLILDQQEYSMAQLSCFLGDYNFMRFTRDGGVEYFLKELQSAVRKKDSNYNLSHQILKKAFNTFMEEQSEEYSQLNTLLSLVTKKQNAAHPELIKNIKNNALEAGEVKAIISLIEMGKNNQELGLLRSFHNTLLDAMDAEVQAIKKIKAENH